MVNSRGSPAVPVPVSLAACHAAWRRARKGKRPSANQLAFALRWLSQLQELQATLRAGQWWPERTVSFVVTHPKTREIHAPQFRDQVVHHLLVERLEKLYEPRFIHDSFANRSGKGSHAAVDRLRDFMRSRENMGHGGGWYLQLDVHNYFNNIHRPTLYQMLCTRMALAERRAELPGSHAAGLRSLCHRLLARRLPEHVLNPRRAAAVPAHKRLCNAAPGCGLPVGNLTSQFFANMYLDALDQFVKHGLKVRHYLRYVDDFLLLADSQQQLLQWHAAIGDFLRDKLHLTLKDGATPTPCAKGIDFLGYGVFAHHRRVRQRVVGHCRAPWAMAPAPPRSAAWRTPGVPRLRPPAGRAGQLLGHFSHADSTRLKIKLVAEQPWLAELFDLQPDGNLVPAAPARWTVRRHQAVRAILQPEEARPCRR